MPTKQELRKRLVAKLQELFQLDQPDLDFGFYRIMHTKAEQVTHFLEHDLLNIIETAFGDESDTQHAALKAEYDQALKTAEEYGAADPENAPKVIAVRERLAAALQNANAEGEIYDHLYRFFERYYDRGDFISRRYYTRETAGKAAPFAIPYNGEEVKLHWANADQYYIKTAEHFTNSTFDLNQAPEVQATRQGQLPLDSLDDDGPRRVHFRIVEASEGAHGNVKASDSETRFFLIHQPNPVELNAVGELVINFEYRPDPEKSGQEATWRDKRNTEAVAVILNALNALSSPPNHQSPITNPHPSIENQKSKIENYLRLLQTSAPTEKDAKRPLLSKYVNRYTGRNTYDYFIHKDLSGFLRRELDFYIKNEVMRLDDIEEADARSVESYLSRLKVLRRIASEIITFLAQLEEFQKKLWLKKKFVVETNYCITLDRIPAEFYAEIAANDAQREEWVRLYAIDEIELSTVEPGYSIPLTTEFLRCNQYMMVDTRLFDTYFTERLLSSISDIDENCDGLLCQSENGQALRFLSERYHGAIGSCYIDPPYNTGSDGFLYKDTYQHSTWYSMLFDRMYTVQRLTNETSLIASSVDDNELCRLGIILDSIWGETQRAAYAPWKSEASGGKEKTGLRTGHEYLLIYYRGTASDISQDERSTGSLNLTDKYGKYRKGRELRKWGGTYLREDRQNQYYPLFAPDGSEAYPIRNDGKEGHWRWGKTNPNIIRALNDPDFFHWEITSYDPGVTYQGETERWTPYEKIRDEKKSVGWSTWLDSFGTNADGTRSLKDLFGTKVFDTPKPVQLIEWFISLNGDDTSVSLDFFAGAGVLRHAVINLNRSTGEQRKYVLVEVGSHFEDVLKSRVQKAAYCADWKDGKPVDRVTGLSHCIKVICLESYEDTLNNLAFDDDPVRQQVLSANADLRKDYMLRYLLDVETQGSQSLLNVDAFADPTAYTLKVKKPGSDEYTVKAVDLLETFNYLIGLRVVHIAAPQSFTATFQRQPDPELPQDHQTRLVLTSRMQQVDSAQIENRQSKIENSPTWWFRKVEGWVPADPMHPNNGQRQNVLIIWRKLTGNLEEDNLMLDEWFRHNRINPRDAEFDIIYVNGSNNLANLRQEGDTWKVRLLEEEFMRRMWEGDVLQ